MLKWVASSSAFCLGFILVACGGEDTPPANGQELSSAADSDLDGIVDSCEGTGDGDGDGQPAWQDADEKVPCGGGATSGSATTGSTSASTGATGTTADGTAVWTASRVFIAGDVVEHDGVTYTAQWWTRNQEPGSSPWGPWQAGS